MPDHPIHIAAIDAGSNGIRLVLGTINGQNKLAEVENYRESVRLGADAFGPGQFSEETIKQTVGAFGRFRKILDSHGVMHIRAVATSAAREAANGQALADRVRESSGIRLEIIDGIEEAQLIFRAIADHEDLTGRSALLVDMGGGSVEVTVARNARAMACETLRMGAVRLQEKLRAQRLPESGVLELLQPYEGMVRSLVRSALGSKQPDIAFGSGGGIETMAKLRIDLLGKSKPGKVKPSDLDKLIDILEPMPIAQRVKQIGLREDRADLIVIAMYVLRHIMKETGMPRLFVPGVGLKEGLLRQVAWLAGCSL